MNDGFLYMTGEQTRVYTYENREIQITGIVKMRLEQDGSHTLVQADGSYYIMAPGWIMVTCSPNLIVV